MMSDVEVSDTPRSGRLKKRNFLSRMAENSSNPSSPASSLNSLRQPLPARRSPLAQPPLTPLEGDRGPQALGDSFNHKFGNLSMLSAGSLSEEDLPPASLKRMHDVIAQSGGSDESESEKPSSRKRTNDEALESGFREQGPTRSSHSPVQHMESLPELLTSSRRLGRLERRTEESLGRSASSELLSRPSSASRGPTPLPVSRARSQGFLVGAMSGASGAMLGAEELERTFPERQLRVYAVTWNIGCLKPSEYPSSLELLLFPDTLEHLPDVYVIGIQEISPDKKEWTLRLQATLGPNFVPYECASMGTLHLSVFLRRDLIWFVSVPESASVSTRAAISTKGAVGICFMIFGTSILVINSHFKSDDGNFKARVDDYNKIVTALALPKQIVQNEYIRNSASVASRFDCVLWMGDLNFRIDRPRDIVERVLTSIRTGDHPNYEDLLVGDELLQARAEGTCFQEFDEGRINFAPTYKFDQLSDVYDTSGKMRIPSYTDRIMYRVRRRGSVSCIEYDSLPQVKFSDHRPVYGLFEVDVKPGQDNIPLAAGSFLRDLYMEGNRRRALRLDLEALKTERANSRVCVLQ